MSRPSKTLIRPSPAVAGLRGYHVPRPPHPIDLYLDGNEGLTAPVSIVGGLRGLMPGVVRRYPSTRSLESVIAERLGLGADRVLVTAGGDDAICRACHAVLSEGREMVLPVPTFEMFTRYARLAGGTVVTVPWPRGAYPADAVLGAITRRTSIVVVVSPNNPTGAVAKAADIRRLAKAAPHALVVVDLAYAEFADEDLMPAALSLPNAVAVRSFSKAWGMAGLRLGYAAGPAGIIDWMRAAGSPYAVAGPSVAVAGAWLARGGAQVDAFVKRIRRERETLAGTLQSLGAAPLPSQANFVLARFADAQGVWNGLARRGIAVRAFPNQEGLDDCLRITCPGNVKDFRRLESAIETVLGD